MSRPKNKSSIHQAILNHSFTDLVNALARGDDVDAKDRDGRTPLFYAVQNGDSQSVIALVDGGADVNAKDVNVETPLHFTARCRQPEIALFLIEQGAFIDSVDSNGNTPLWRAVFESRGREEMIKIFLSVGADKSKKIYMAFLHRILQIKLPILISAICSNNLRYPIE